MNSQKSTKRTHSTQTSQNAEQTAEVLYQRLGNKWYAFSLIGDDVFVGAIQPDALAEEKNLLSPAEKKARRIRTGSA